MCTLLSGELWRLVSAQWLPCGRDSARLLTRLANLFQLCRRFARRGGNLRLVASLLPPPRRFNAPCNLKVQNMVFYWDYDDRIKPSTL